MTRKEYNQLVDTATNVLYGFICKMTRNTHDAEDIVQEAFARLWTVRKKVEAPGAKAFLFRIAYNLHIDMARKKNKTIFPGEMPEVEAWCPHSYDNTYEIIREAFDTLPESQKALLVLKEANDYSHKEMADITGLNETQVKVYLHRARTALRSVYNTLNQLPVL